jgi:hypothetical protein
MAIAFPSWMIEAATVWNEDVAFLLDAELRFVDCNPGWDKFASANGARDIWRSDMMGRLVLDFVPDVLRTYYVHKYWFAKRSTGWTEFDFDCNSPEKLRIFSMAIMGVEEGLLVVNHLRVEEDCEPSPPMSDIELSAYISNQGMATMCANCRKTMRRDDASVWTWLPKFLGADNLKVSHGLCPRCVSLYS